MFRQLLTEGDKRVVVPERIVFVKQFLDKEKAEQWIEILARTMGCTVYMRAGLEGRGMVTIETDDESVLREARRVVDDMIVEYDTLTRGAWIDMVLCRKC